MAVWAAITVASVPAHAAGPSGSLIAMLTDAVTSFPDTRINFGLPA